MASRAREGKREELRDEQNESYRALEAHRESRQACSAREIRAIGAQSFRERERSLGEGSHQEWSLLEVFLGLREVSAAGEAAAGRAKKAP